MTNRTVANLLSAVRKMTTPEYRALLKELGVSHLLEQAEMTTEECMETIGSITRNHQTIEEAKLFLPVVASAMISPNADKTPPYAVIQRLQLFIHGLN